MPIHILEDYCDTGRSGLAAQLVALYELPVGAARAHRALTTRISARAFELFVREVLLKEVQINAPPEILWGVPILRGGLSMVDNNVDVFNRILSGMSLPPLKMSAVSVKVNHVGNGERYNSASIRWSAFKNTRPIQKTGSESNRASAEEAVIVFDWGIATGLTLRTVFDWLKAHGYHDKNLFCLSLIGVPDEIKDKFPNEHVTIAVEAAFRPGTIYVDRIGGTHLSQYKDWGHSHYPTDTREEVAELVESLNRVLALGEGDINTITRLYSGRQSFVI